MELSITYNYIDIGQTCRLYTTILRSDMSIAYKKSQRTSNNRISCHHIMNLYCAALSIITWNSHIFPYSTVSLLSHGVLTLDHTLCHVTVTWIITLCLSRMLYALLTLCRIRLTRAVLTLCRTRMSYAIVT
jgi:hypothetical protein